MYNHISVLSTAWQLLKHLLPLRKLQTCSRRTWHMLWSMHIQQAQGSMHSLQADCPKHPVTPQSLAAAPARHQVMRLPLCRLLHQELHLFSQQHPWQTLRAATMDMLVSTIMQVCLVSLASTHSASCGMSLSACPSLYNVLHNRYKLCLLS